MGWLKLGPVARNRNVALPLKKFVDSNINCGCAVTTFLSQIGCVMFGSIKIFNGRGNLVVLTFFWKGRVSRGFRGAMALPKISQHYLNVFCFFSCLPFPQLKFPLFSISSLNFRQLSQDNLVNTTKHFP